MFVHVPIECATDFFWRFDRKAILAQFWRMRQTIAPLRLAHSIGTGLKE
jgi:hypothetical protein